ncbi:MAG: Mov34/MPN/PAD-1 family protein [Desulfobulbaceae bacterium]|nr:Mov34/MPN/PAD-1 family protein [Desulfobulbaceae bacterium]
MKITDGVIKAIVAHGRQEMPNEACGYLAEQDGVIVRHYALTNLDKAADHYTMEPREQFAAIKDMRGRKLKLAAVYHSHPETPARPSAEDIRLAYDPEISYLIVSLAGPEPVVKSFKIANNTVQPEEITIVMEEEPMRIKADAVKNCRGVGCPMNLVHTKVGLAALQPGQILEVILDDGPPVTNVPASASREGHKVLAQNRLADGAWSVLLEKG